MRTVALATVGVTLVGGLLDLASFPQVLANAVYAAAIVLAVPPIAARAIAGPLDGRRPEAGLVILLGLAAAVAAGEWMAAALLGMIALAGDRLQRTSLAGIHRELDALRWPTPAEARRRREPERAGEHEALDDVEQEAVGVVQIVAVLPGELVPSTERSSSAERAWMSRSSPVGGPPSIVVRGTRWPRGRSTAPSACYFVRHGSGPILATGGSSARRTMPRNGLRHPRRR